MGCHQAQVAMQCFIETIHPADATPTEDQDPRWRTIGVEPSKFGLSDNSVLQKTLPD